MQCSIVAILRQTSTVTRAIYSTRSIDASSTEVKTSAINFVATVPVGVRYARNNCETEQLTFIEITATAIDNEKIVPRPAETTDEIGEPSRIPSIVSVSKSEIAASATDAP